MKQIVRKYYLFDARGEVLGRMATKIARILVGKDRVDFTPHIDGGDCVVVINAAEVVLTGNKEEGKTYHRHTGYPGGLKKTAVGAQRKRDPRKMIERAVYGMLPKNNTRAARMRRLFIYADEKHPHKTIHRRQEVASSK